MSSRQARRYRSGAAGTAAAVLVALLAGCATTGAVRAGRRAEQAQNYDLAVVEYTKAVRAQPDNVDARAALERAKLRAAQVHTASGRRFAAQGRYEEAFVEFQLAFELNPTDALVVAALRDARQLLRTKVADLRYGRTGLENLNGGR